MPLLIYLFYFYGIYRVAMWMKKVRVGHSIDPGSIKQGSLLIAAARKGEIGYTEKFLTDLQNQYASPVLRGLHLDWRLHAFLFLATSFLFLQGVGEWLDGYPPGFLCVIKAVVGLTFCVLLIVFNFNIKRNREEAVKTYTRILKSEAAI